MLFFMFHATTVLYILLEKRVVPGKTLGNPNNGSANNQEAPIIIIGNNHQAPTHRGSM